MGRPILGVTIAIGVGLTLACQIPSTLGLPCRTHEHCDAGQSCVAEVCQPGAPMMPGTTGQLPDPTTGAVDQTTTGAVDSTGTPGDSTSSGSTSMPVMDTTSSSTGVACGVDACTDLDILVVLDNSDSMVQWLVPLANSIPSLIGLISEELNKACTFRIGLTTSNELPPDNPKACMFPGALLHRPERCGGGDGVLPWWSQDNGTPGEVLDELRCLIIDQGTGGSPDEHMLDAMLGALDPANNANEACNASFRRPDANLLILYISDENDPTPQDEQDTVAETFQSWVDPNLVAFIAVVADDARECPWEPADTGDDGMGAEVPSALNGFLALSDIPFDQRAIVDICEDGTYAFERAFDVFETTCDR